MASKRPPPFDSPGGDSKRIRSNNGSPAPVQAGETDAERRKRETQERLAAVKARLAASKPNGAPPPPPSLPQAPPPPTANGGAPDIEAKKAEAQRKIEAMKARMTAQRGQGQQQQTASPVNGGVGAPPQQMSEREARIAEARARAAELSRQKGTASPSTQAPAAAAAPPPRQDGKTARGGLGIGLHPSLMGDAAAGSAGAKQKQQNQGPKFSTTKGNQQPDIPRINPYLSIPEDEPTTRQVQGQGQDDNEAFDSTLITRKAGERKTRALHFNAKGKFMAQANALRQQARLEEMKRRLAAETRKVEIEEASDKAFLVPAPPEVEWWDEGLLPSGQNSYTDCLDDGKNKIETPDTIITALIQHPVILTAPQDKFIPDAKPLMLTTKEQKKLRRQRRMADMKEEQAKIRLGLVEPPPPKVKKSNMMRVLGEQAVKDPTAVEARVNKEIAGRLYDHNKSNEDRKLTKEQREEKLKRQQEGDEAKGVKIAVFRVDNLSSGKHRYQVDVNAKQNALTGIVVLHPEMNLVIVEGGIHSINAYKKLMLNRIKWSENTLPVGDSNPTTFTGTSKADSKDVPANPNLTEQHSGSKAAKWLSPIDEHGDLKDLSENSCVLVWEGDEQARRFKRWGSRAVETDGEARDVLTRGGMENMWTLGRSGAGREG